MTKREGETPPFLFAFAAAAAAAAVAAIWPRQLAEYGRPISAFRGVRDQHVTKCKRH